MRTCSAQRTPGKHPLHTPQTERTEHSMPLKMPGELDHGVSMSIILAGER